MTNLYLGEDEKWCQAQVGCMRRLLKWICCEGGEGAIVFDLKMAVKAGI